MATRKKMAVMSLEVLRAESAAAHVVLKKELDVIRNEGSDRSDIIDKMSKMVTETHTAITGNHALGHVGIAQRLVVAEKSIRDLWSSKMKLVGAYSVITVVAIVIGPILAEWFKKFFGN